VARYGEKIPGEASRVAQLAHAHPEIVCTQQRIQRPQLTFSSYHTCTTADPEWNMVDPTNQSMFGLYTKLGLTGATAEMDVLHSDLFPRRLDRSTVPSISQRRMPHTLVIRRNFSCFSHNTFPAIGRLIDSDLTERSSAKVVVNLGGGQLSVHTSHTPRAETSSCNPFGLDEKVTA
jgi:hypothetical protein